MKIKSVLILENPKTRIEKAIKWLKMQEKKSELDPLTKAKRILYILEQSKSRSTINFN